MGEIEGNDALLIRGALKHFWMAQGADGVVIAGTQCSRMLAREKS